MPSATMMSNQSRLDRARRAAVISSFSAARLRERKPDEAKRGSAPIFSRSISLQNFTKFLLLVAARLRKPSAVGNSPIGVLVGWLLPSCGGTFLSLVQRVGLKSISVMPASASEGCTPRPSSAFRFSVMARLLRCRFWKSEPSRRPTTSLASPASGGGSTRITSAPQSASVRTQDGPARAKVKSSTLNRDSGRRGDWSCGVAWSALSTGLCMLVVLDRDDVRRVDLQPDFLADVENADRRRHHAQLEIAGIGAEGVVPALAEKGALGNAARQDHGIARGAGGMQREGLRAQREFACND